MIAYTDYLKRFVVEKKSLVGIEAGSSYSKHCRVFIRYFTADGKDGKVAFYDDIYGEDKYIRARYFPGK